MRKVLVLFLISLSSFASFGQPTVLSEKASISIITFGAGQEELYTAFGHSAIRLYDSLNGTDIIFNYGVFNFDQPHFYLNFARGYLYYMVDIYPYDLFRDHYIKRNRFVHEQVLELTQIQKQKIANFLFWNMRPENQTYRYDYFYNNCATKVRDVFEHVLKGEMSFDSTFIKTNYTIRQLTDIYLGQQPWGDLGIDICLGLPMDKKAGPREYMFLPDYVESSFDHMTNTSTGKPLVRDKIIVFQSEESKAPFHWFHPWIVFGIVFAGVAFVTWRDWQRKKLTKWLDVTLFLIIGILGILLLFLWTMTDHQAAAKNFNLLWALPTHAVFAIFLLRKQKPKWMSHYFLFTTVLCALLLGVWYLLPQMLNVFLIPVVGMILVRSLINLPQMAQVGADRSTKN
ncbi:hypothetical protein WSM22_21980 [Cytophagales bacterium WSM2-2]|nr:hypothetical protein WSM22_21980 [Cytophagales bacterium WSM2-2]